MIAENAVDAMIAYFNATLMDLAAKDISTNMMCR